MNLRSIYLVCDKNLEAIKNLKGSTITINGRTGRKVEGWEDCRNAVEELQKIETFTQECTDLLNAVPSFYRTQDTFEILEAEWKKINDERNYVHRTMIDIMDLCEKMGIDNEVGFVGLDIKLPAYSDFSEFVGYVNDIEFILTKCPFLQNDSEKIEFRNVDVGSTWLEFVVNGVLITAGASIILNNIAAFVDKCIIIRSHFLTTEKQKLDLEADKRNQADKEVIQNYILEQYKKEVDAAISDLEKVTGYKVENRDGDEYLRIEQCMNKMGVLLEKGLQIHASINSSKEVQVLFEPLEMKYIEYQKKIELLEANQTDGEE